MYYIYSLSFNEVPFYIGMTNSPMLTKAGFTLLNDRHHVNIGNRHRRKGLPPIYDHYNKLPYKWFTKELRASIFNQQLNVSKINYTHDGK